MLLAKKNANISQSEAKAKALLDEKHALAVEEGEKLSSCAKDSLKACTKIVLDKILA